MFIIHDCPGEKQGLFLREGCNLRVLSCARWCVSQAIAMDRVDKGIFGGEGKGKSYSEVEW
jgi:hypothetical protein